MLLYLLTCISLVLFFKSLLPLKPLPPRANEMRLNSLLLCIELLSIGSISKFIRNYRLSFLCELPSRISLGKKSQPSKVDCVEDHGDTSILDLPDLALECILEKLSPPALCRMAGVCHSLRERCVSDHLWERHMKQKWGRVVGSTAHREWQWYTASERDAESLNHGKQRGLMRLISLGWPFSWIRIRVEASNSIKQQSSLPVYSVMTKYLALETGNFWFHAQVYNRESGKVGFVLSCYDAELSYDPCTDTFQARYPPHGRRAAAIEKGIPWKRLRAPPVDTSPHDLHISNCLNDLRPGDHIEIQWRRNIEFPYGWWYGVVGHLESCDGNEFYCRCHSSDTVVLEFNQYAPGSRWRQATVNRKDHREKGNEADGFYGGIRKLENVNEISKWKRLWPSELLD